MKPVLIFCLCLWLVNTKAQDIPFRTVTVEDGLSNNFVKTIFKDSRGFIWVGTLEGLDRFDGISFKPYMQHSGSVNAMIETSPNFLWVATEQGLWKLDYATEQLELVSLNGITGQVLSLAKDVNNRLLIGTNRGLFVVTETGMLHIQLDSSAVTSSSNNITGIEPGALYSCWIATSSSLFHCDYSSPQAKIDRFEASDPSVNVFSGIAKIGNSLYLGTKNKGLQKFDIQTKTFTPYIDIGNKFILKISGDGADRLLVGTDGSGLKEISVKSNTVISYTSSQDPSSIRSNAVYSFLETDGILWIGTYSAGLSYSLEKPFQVYSYGNSFPTRDKQIRSLNFNGSSSEKLLGTRDGFVYINEDRHIFNYFSADQQRREALHSNLILSIYPFDGKFPDRYVWWRTFCFRPGQSNDSCFSTRTGILAWLFL